MRAQVHCHFMPKMQMPIRKNKKDQISEGIDYFNLNFSFR